MRKFGATGRSRRDLLAVALGGGAALAAPGLGWGMDAGAPSAARMRVISDNDFGGDPDGLFQLAHHLLCPSVSVPLIVGAHLHAKEAWDPTQSGRQASNAADKARELLQVMGQAGRHTVLAGAEAAISSRSTWSPSPATAAIVAEAMRADARTPLYYASGAGLTELALAWLAEPRIGSRLRLVWIGGREHPGLAYPPPGPAEAEYNFTIDPLAAQIIFNESDIEIWQVPRDAYRQMLFSFAELEELARTGAPGRWLASQVDRVRAALAHAPPEAGLAMGETYVLGDSPLVTLTALQSPFQPDPSSSRYTRMPTPRLNDKGEYEAREGGRPMRVYTSIDAGLTFRDMVARIRAAGETSPAA